MKKSLAEKIKFHKDTKKYTKIFRKVAKDTVVTSHGYILDYSDDFILLQNAGDFLALGYEVLPVKQIEKVRYNNWDKYFVKIMQAEHEIDQIKIDYVIDLQNWQTVFNTIKENVPAVIVECEDPDIGNFTIGPIIKTGKKKVQIHNFDPAGYFDEMPEKIDYAHITRVAFDGRYENVFSKYTRHRKEKPV